MPDDNTSTVTAESAVSSTPLGLSNILGPTYQSEDLKDPKVQQAIKTIKETETTENAKLEASEKSITEAMTTQAEHAAQRPEQQKVPEYQEPQQQWPWQQQDVMPWIKFVGSALIMTGIIGSAVAAKDGAMAMTALASFLQGVKENDQATAQASMGKYKMHVHAIIKNNESELKGYENILYSDKLSVSEKLQQFNLTSRQANNHLNRDVKTLKDAINAVQQAKNNTEKLKQGNEKIKNTKEKSDKTNEMKNAEKMLDDYCEANKISREEAAAQGITVGNILADMTDASKGSAIKKKFREATENAFVARAQEKYPNEHTPGTASKSKGKVVAVVGKDGQWHKPKLDAQKQPIKSGDDWVADEGVEVKKSKGWKFWQ